MLEREKPPTPLYGNGKRMEWGLGEVHIDIINLEYPMKLSKHLLLCLMVFSAIRVSAQTETNDTWYVGGGLGVHFGKMTFSELSKDRYSKNVGSWSSVFSVFAQRDFGKSQNILVRPQLSFLSRGGKLTGFEKYGGYSNPDLDDVFYQVNAKFVDMRCAVAFLLGNTWGGIRPYFGITPIIGFPVGGTIRLQEDYSNFRYRGYLVNLNKSNFASSYLAVAPTVGFRYDLKQRMHIGLEVSYQVGLTDTYSSVEKKGNADDVYRGVEYGFTGSRRMHGLEVQLTLAIPLGRRPKAAPAPVEQYVEPAPVEKPKPVIRTKVCYTLEEITDMLARNESVVGKTLCAINDINFDFGKSTIKPESYEYLDKLAEILIRTRSKVIVKGHTDNVGSDDFNMKLSKNRAEAVVKFLVSRGVNQNLLSVEYYGASLPLMDNDTEEGRTYNRRVEFEIQK